MNDLEVVTAASEKYADYFGFTEEEVFAALEEHGMTDRRSEVKEWYDGFTFGNKTDIYNPWSIINFLDKGQGEPIGLTPPPTVLQESWFRGCRRVHNAFLQALMTHDVRRMNVYMNKVTAEMFSYFDTGKSPSEKEQERFYHRIQSAGREREGTV